MMIDGKGIADYWDDDDPERVYTREEVEQIMERAFRFGQLEAKTFVLTLLSGYHGVNLLSDFAFNLISKGIEDGV